MWNVDTKHESHYPESSCDPRILMSCNELYQETSLPVGIGVFIPCSTQYQCLLGIGTARTTCNSNSNSDTRRNMKMLAVIHLIHSLNSYNSP